MNFRTDQPAAQRPCCVHPETHGEWLGWGGRWLCSDCFNAWEDTAAAYPDTAEGFEAWGRARKQAV